MQRSKIGIIGLGLIGGSIAKKLKELNIPCHVIIDIDENVINEANKLNLARYCGSSSEKLNDCDLVIFCTPFNVFDQILRSVLTANNNKNILFTDVMSLKQPIQAAVNNLENDIDFIGGHPMAGKEVGGFTNASCTLFLNKPWVLSPNSKTSDSSLELLREFVNLLGAVPIIMTPEEHDIAAAEISHLPHILASSLMNCTEENSLKISGSSWEDMTRIAASAPQMWADISIANSQNLIESIDKLETQLRLFRTALLEKDRVNLITLFSNSKNK